MSQTVDGSDGESLAELVAANPQEARALADKAPDGGPLEQRLRAALDDAQNGGQP